ncbi:PP2C family protein-serine/threonine phosphatase [Solirubrum puertoriconensis]|uniref:Serine/threonine protein phosphatase n=1 Tax=Solirubrum puertoriconensis TaxID=1751427 RepID=A0A9X0HJS8_SOLP1|nr:PP2C family protein-serine/threonine phosphatase [Solirubrum puertoriconensis]KUG07276.1 serine/threonine protein phosphatase [Solirubrum puertoriconensis]
MPDTLRPLTKEEHLLLKLKERELAALLEITQAINGEPNDENLYKIFQFTLLGQLGVRQLAVYVVEDEQWRCAVAFGPGMPDFRGITLPDQLQRFPPEHPVDVIDLELGKPWDFFATVMPVRQSEQLLGLVFIGPLHQNYTSSLEARREAVTFIDSLSQILFGAVSSRRLMRQQVQAAAVRKEIEIAQEVQAMLFPSKLPNDQHVAVHATYVPHTAVGGDFYDVVPINKNRFLFCVADVSGKGVGASLLMSNFQAGLRTLLRQQVDLATVVGELNNLIFRNSGGDRFITAFFGEYDRTTRELRYVNAGHNDPMLLPDLGHGPIQLLKDGTIMLGVMDELPMLKVGQVQVPIHSMLLCYTDGLTEVFDAQHEEFGEPGVLETLQTNRYLPLPKLHDELLRRIEAFNVNGNHFADDITILSCRFR